MKKSLCLLLLSTSLLYACQSNGSVSSSEKKLDELPQDVQSFFSSVNEENGVYLYDDAQSNTLLIYLNSYKVEQGDPADNFNSFKAVAEENTLHLSYNTDTTPLYDSAIDNQLYYEVTLDKRYDTIKLFNNGDEVEFDNISGNHK